METEDRWYVRFRGHTLGPLTSEQVKSSVRRQELGPDDKVASTRDPSWRSLRTQKEFLRCWESLSRPLPVELTPLPSPKILWQKKRAALPVARAKSEAVRALVENAPAAPITEPVQLRPTPAENALKRKPEAKTKAKPAKKIAAKKLAARQNAKKASPTASTKKKPAIAETVIPSAAIPSSTPLVPRVPAPSPQLAEEALSLLDTLRDWNRQEQKQAGDAKPAAFRIPEQPAPELAGPAFGSPAAEAALPADAKPGIELRLNLTITKQFIFIFSAVAAIALAAILFSLTSAQKMRGPADFRLPDPSDPTTNPSLENDPIPQLKAPTRPKRD